MPVSREPRESSPELSPELASYIRGSLASAAAPAEPAIIVGMPILSVGVTRDDDLATVDESDWGPTSPARTASAVEWAEAEFVPAPSSNATSHAAGADGDYIEVDETDLVPSSRPDDAMSSAELAFSELAASDAESAASETSEIELATLVTRSTDDRASMDSFHDELGAEDMEPEMPDSEAQELDIEPPTLHKDRERPSYRPGPTFHTDLAALHKELAQFDMKPPAQSAHLVPIEPAAPAPEPDARRAAEPLPGAVAATEGPIAPDSSEPEKKAAPRPSVIPSAQAPVVMIVEDDATIREMLTLSLGTDYCVYEASDGVVALDMLSRMTTPDLLLLDVRMPRMDGLALAGRVRQDTRMRMVPIIFLSGLDAPRDVVNGINAGARQYVTKPFKMHDLKRRVDRALAHRAV